MRLNSLKPITELSVNQEIYFRRAPETVTIINLIFLKTALLYTVKFIVTTETLENFRLK